MCRCSSERVVLSLSSFAWLRMVKDVECLLDCRLVKLGPGGGEEVVLLVLLLVERSEVGAECVRAGRVGVRGGE